MTASYEPDAQRSVNLIFAALTIGAAMIWAAADYSSAREAGSEVMPPPSSELVSASVGAACSAVGPSARTQAAGTAAREPLVAVSGTEG